MPSEEQTSTVDVIIPARNAAATIQETLDSLLAQSHARWRALVIDDGSTDNTRAIAEAYAARDARFELLQGPARGVSAARNLGLQAARADWLLFLDADDTLEPAMLERMLATLAAHPDADAVHCGWTFIDREGRAIGVGSCGETGADLFPVFARYCAFGIHACVVSREAAAKAGGFDETLTTSEDFDLWQRIARTGARFVRLPQPLVSWRLRTQATWFDAAAFARDVLQVARRGHARDPRLQPAATAPEHMEGEPASRLGDAELQLIVWAGALALARGADARPLVELLDGAVERPAKAGDLAETLRRGICLASCLPTSAWGSLWPKVEAPLAAFLEVLEQRLASPGLAGAVIGEAAPASTRPGFTASIEATQPIPDLATGDAEELECEVLCEGRILGRLQLPVFDGRASGAVIADAIAARFAWVLLGILFGRQVYPGLGSKQEADGWSVWRSGVRLAAGLREDARGGEKLHDAVGWTVLVQELTGAAGSLERLYDPQFADPFTAGESPYSGSAHPVDLARPIPSLVGVEQEALIEASLGGSPLMLTAVKASGGRVEAGAIRSALLDRGKMELARIAVREAVIGVAMDDPASLRSRLQRRADEVEAKPVPPHAPLAAAPSAERAARWARLAAARVDLTGGAVAAIGAGPAQAAGVPELRRGALPRRALKALLQDLAPGQAAIRVGEGEIARILHLPELLPETPWGQDGPADEGAGSVEKAYGRHHFESLFASGADPWKYASAYEQTKYEQTLELCLTGPDISVWEIGCAEGHFTVQLAPKVGKLLATDFSEVALARAAERCKGMDNVSYAYFDLAKDPAPGSFDLILCCELLYFMDSRAKLAEVGAKMARALKPGGRLVTAHANLVVDSPNECGFDWRMPFGARTIGETFARIPQLRFARELRTPLYRIQVFERRERPGLFSFLKPRREPAVIEARHADPEPHVAEHILWNGGQVAAAPLDEVTTYHLPVLMYHRVASDGPQALSRWRVTPEAFEAQLRYLRGAGFRPVSLEEWRRARETSQPLPGRRVLITFDDGYRDFEEHAAPALARHGFPALVFLPTDLVGDSARWDEDSGEAAPLMDWDTIRRLTAQGFSFGSHAASHRRLTGLAAEAVVEELLRSREALRRELGIATDAIAFPFGAFDETVTRLAASLGFVHGFTTREGLSNLYESGLSQSRVEVMGDEPIERFIGRLTAA